MPAVPVLVQDRDEDQLKREALLTFALSVGYAARCAGMLQSQGCMFA